jgi:hypothetical protein
MRSILDNIKNQKQNNLDDILLLDEKLKILESKFSRFLKTSISRKYNQ